MTLDEFWKELADWSPWDQVTDLGAQSRSPSGETPLHFAVYLGAQDCIAPLAQAGAELDAQCERGETALHAAARRGDAAAIEHLLRLGARTGLRNAQGLTEAEVASESGHAEAAQRLSNVPASAPVPAVRTAPDTRAGASTLLEQWAPLLSRKLGRPAAELLAHGLREDEVSAEHRVELTLADGSYCRFVGARCVRDDERRRLAVFTARSGHHEFPLSGALIKEIHEVTHVDKDHSA